MYLFVITRTNQYAMKNYFSKIILIFALSFAIPFFCQAQYTTGIGIRAGKFASGLDVKYFFNWKKQLALEFNGGYTLEAHGGYFGKLFLLKQVAITKADVPFPFRMIFKQSRLQ